MVLNLHNIPGALDVLLKGTQLASKPQVVLLKTIWHGKEVFRKDLKIHLKKLTVVSTEGRMMIAKDTALTVRMWNQ
eukprot:5143901-Ditylum_brightwellii.AAC.1